MKDIVKGIKFLWWVLFEMVYYGCGKLVEMFNFFGLIFVYKNSLKIFFDCRLIFRNIS